MSILDEIQLMRTPLNPELFDRIATECAQIVAESGGRDKNKSTQLRKFYDELVEWQEKIGLDATVFEEHLALVMMLKAKVAYAEGRGHVTQDFGRLLGTLLDQVKQANDPKALLNAKLFFEAFLGFYKTFNRN